MSRGISPVVPSEGEGEESICEGGGLMYVPKRINKRNAGIRKRTRFIEAPIRIVRNIFPNKGIVSTPDFGRNGFPAYGSPEIRRSLADQSIPKRFFLSQEDIGRVPPFLYGPGKGRLDAEEGEGGNRNGRCLFPRLQGEEVSRRRLGEGIPFRKTFLTTR